MTNNNTINSIDDYLKKLLDPEPMADIALNGIQVECSGSIKKIAFAVDACYQSLERAVKEKCNLLIVHHGIFWSSILPIRGPHKKRLDLMLKNNLGLIAYHLPLDRHLELGNNAVILKKLALKQLVPFGFSRGIALGYLGYADQGLKMDEIISQLEFDPKICRGLAFGKQEIKKIAVISGGGSRFFEEAAQNSVDLFITGDPDHTLYHAARERGINLLFAGHYQTETFGVKSLQQKIAADLAVETLFLDIPTGL